MRRIVKGIPVKSLMDFAKLNKKATYILSFLMIHLSTVDICPRIPGDYNMVLAFTTMLVPLLDVVRVVLDIILHKRGTTDVV